ncbi:MAG: S9 family peptidase [Odoribacter sp.]|nr:S9 family peptidase [Odoribacter sp.]
MYLKHLILACSLSAAYATAAMNVHDIKPYVYPDNRPAAPKGFTYAPDGESYFLLSEDARRIERYDTRSGNLIDTLFNVERARETSIASIEGFTLSPDASKIIVWRDATPIYRRSFTAEYFVYEVRSRILSPLSKNKNRQQTPLFSPDSRMVAFVADNNIYVAKLDYHSEVAVTDDGSAGRVINGVPDWVYEEEFATSCSMTWAPDNLNLCYLKYNETDVPTYPMTRYDGLYPQVWTYKYPVAGEKNSTVTLHSYDVETRKTKDISLPDNRIEYIPNIGYGPNPETLVVATLNRDQSLCRIYKVNPKSTIAKEIYSEESDSWILPATYEDLRLEPDKMVVTSWRDGNTKLYFYNYNGVETQSPATGDVDITAYYGTDTQGNIYYQAAAPTPLDRTVKRLDRKGNVTTLSPSTGTGSASFAPGMKYAVMSYNSPSQPPVYTMVTVGNGKELRVIEDNASYATGALQRVAAREFFTMQSDGNTLNGYIVKPRDFSPSKKYPVVMYQYSGPGSQEVLNRWQLDWMDAYAAQGFVIICVDGRGTGGRGRDFCDIVYKNLGYYETIDQIAAARYASTLPYVDPSRIAIYGWSYGGYEALMCATANDAPYKAAVAIAPVTDWRFYDTVYAERYLQTPGQNDDGYNSSAPLKRAARLNCPLLIMYGTSDDNVHPENTIEFVNELEGCGKFCDMLLFPNKNHSIYGGNARAVVYLKMLDWLNINL